MTLSSSHQRNGRLDPPFASPRQLALIAILVWLVGAVIHPLAILATIGLVLLLVAGVAYLARPKRHTMNWRGREIDLDDRGGLGEQLYRLLFRH